MERCSRFPHGFVNLNILFFTHIPSKKIIIFIWYYICDNYYFLGVLKQVLEKCVEGASVREICEYGDNLLTEETSKVFKKEKELKKELQKILQMKVNVNLSEPEKMSNLFNTHIINVASKSTLYLRIRIIKSLKNNAAPGYDGIKAKTVKKVASTLAPILSKINKCFIAGEFPDVLTFKNC